MTLIGYARPGGSADAGGDTLPEVPILEFTPPFIRGFSPHNAVQSSDLRLRCLGILHERRLASRF
jgi:hypothetical protein